LISLIHFSILFGNFSAYSILLIAKSLLYCNFFVFERNCNSNTVGSDWFEHGSSRYLNPKPSSLLSGLGIFINASNSPIAGIYSGIKHFNGVSNITSCGLYLSIYWNKSRTSTDTFNCK